MRRLQQIKNKFCRRQNNKGSAILIAIFAMILAITIATEIAYETQVEYIGASQQIQRLKAYYAAKSGAEMGLLRILLYQKALAQFGKQLGAQKGMLDMIWKFPYTWPPVGLDQMSNANKNAVQEVVGESLMDAEIVTTISGEGGRIDLNDLASESEDLRNGVRAQLLQIFTSEKESNKEFADKYSNFRFDELVGNIQDWVDEDKNGVVSKREESSIYEQPKDGSTYDLPPNSPFKTIEELHMVAEMTDDLYDLLKDKITVNGSKGINVNTADKAILKSLETGITDEIVSEILKRREDPAQGPFQDDNDFFSFLDTKGVNTRRLRDSKIPFIYESEFSFRIQSSGRSANIFRDITVVTYDINGLTNRVVELLNEEDKKNSQQQQQQQGQGTGGGSGSGSGSGSGTTTTTKKVPKGRPTVVYWQEN
jgi:general secretion pathway protein K